MKTDIEIIEDANANLWDYLEYDGLKHGLDCKHHWDRDKCDCDVKNYKGYVEAIDGAIQRIKEK